MTDFDIYFLRVRCEMWEGWKAGTFQNSMFLGVGKVGIEFMT